MTHTGLQKIEIETGAAPCCTVIWLHGLGADGNDFVPVVEQLTLPPYGIRFIFPHAPLMPVTVNGGLVMPAWYDITEIGATPRAEDEKGLRASAAAVAQLIDAEIARGIAASHIVLGGFSQGGAIALQCGLRYPVSLAGILVLSAYLPLMGSLPHECHRANQTTPVFVGHGTADDMVPLSLATASSARLSQLGYPVEWHTYPMAHGLCGQELADISAWLKRVLPQLPTTQP